MIKVVDIFAGPGGLGEGFSAVKDEKGNSLFDIKLSIEKEKYAFETLKLRTFFRLFPEGAPDDYYKFLRRETTYDTLYKNHATEAEEAIERCWCLTLGPDSNTVIQVRDKIKNIISQDDVWVLIGGPPCQAYSLAGRSRNKGVENYNPNTDIRQRLYVEYLQILADHNPSIFIMENVKGLLSATVQDQNLFGRILDDLRNPADAIKREERSSSSKYAYKYRIYSLVEPREFQNGNTEGAVIKAEKYGIPQARHRVILLGVREDLRDVKPKTLIPKHAVPLDEIIGSLPSLRSGLSRTKDSACSWEQCLRSQQFSHWANGGASDADSPELSEFLRHIIANIHSPVADRGGEFVPCELPIDHYSWWYSDRKIGGVCNHSTRGHMERDLYRYIYAAGYAQLRGKSPTLQSFPIDLLPDHASVESALTHGSNFSDRFRVQISGQPSTTIMSHISKDGHYYIHPDPKQCRSLTVREAARLQTFPDNYFFCGPRTSQYIQVGNAVPPLLARQIAEIVYDLLFQGGAN